MARSICLILCSFFFLITQTATADVTINGVTYSPTTGGYQVWSGSNEASLEILPEIEAYGTTYPVVRIRSFAFYNNSRLESITIPPSIRYVGENAFENCSKLKKVKIANLTDWISMGFANEEANPLFYAHNLIIGEDELPRRLTIPEGVKVIGSYVFAGCTQLVSVDIPSSVRTVGYWPFRDCTNLRKINLPPFKDYLQIYNAGELYRYHADIAYIESKCVTDIQEITLPDTLTVIQPKAFMGWSGLERVGLPETLVSIGMEAFTVPTLLSSGKLEYINFPRSLNSIGEYAFCDQNLKSIYLPSALKYVGNGAFYYAMSKCIVEVEDVEKLCNVVFIYEDMSNTRVANPIQSTGKFYVDNKLVENLIIPASTPMVRPLVFRGAKCLKTIRICGNTVINENAFYECENVTDLCINGGEFKDNAFTLKNLKNVYSLTPTPPTASDVAFSTYKGVNLYVPKGAVDAYANAAECWWLFDNIYECDFENIDDIFGGSSAGLNGINYDGETQSFELYNLEGQPVNGNNIKPGIYIKRQASKVEKILVR